MCGECADGSGAKVGTFGKVPGGIAVSARWLRMLACDAEILPAVLGSDGAILDLGTTTRLFTSNQRHAIGERDGHHCHFPDCQAPEKWCHAHHIRHWADGGPTDIANGVLLCPTHHDLIHHDNWQVRMGNHGHPEYTPPPWTDPPTTPPPPLNGAGRDHRASARAGARPAHPALPRTAAGRPSLPTVPDALSELLRRCLAGWVAPVDRLQPGGRRARERRKPSQRSDHDGNTHSGDPETNTVSAPFVSELGRNDVVSLSAGFGARCRRVWCDLGELPRLVVAELESMEARGPDGHDWGGGHA